MLTIYNGLLEAMGKQSANKSHQNGCSAGFLPSFFPAVVQQRVQNQENRPLDNMAAESTPSSSSTEGRLLEDIVQTQELGEAGKVPLTRPNLLEVTNLPRWEG